MNLDDVGRMAALDPQGLSTTARAVLARLREEPRRPSPP